MITAGFTTTDPITQARTTVIESDEHGGFDASVPVPHQRFVSATIGRLAEALGYHGSYPRFVNG